MRFIFIYFRYKIHIAKDRKVANWATACYQELQMDFYEHVLPESIILISFCSKTD